MSNKTLETAAKDFMDKTLYIGSGSGFFFIGSYEEYKKVIDRISEDYIHSVESQLKTYENRYKRACNDYKVCNHYEAKAQMVEEQAYFDTAKERYEYQLSNRYLSERKVLKVFEDEPKTITIIVEGPEVGQFWTKKDYERSKYHEYFKQRFD